MGRPEEITEIAYVMQVYALHIACAPGRLRWLTIAIKKARLRWLSRRLERLRQTTESELFDALRKLGIHRFYRMYFPEWTSETLGNADSINKCDR